MKIIKTQRLILREIEIEDAKDIYFVAHNKEVAEFLPYIYFENMYEVKHFINRIKENTIYEGQFVIISKNEVVGLITYIKLVNKTIEIKVIIAEKHRGNGYAVEAIQALKDALKVKSSGKGCTLICAKNNEASRNMIKKLNPRSQDKYEGNFQVFVIN